jgi:acetoin utilization protein AcuB
VIVVLVAEVMNRRVVTVAPDATVAEARRLLDERRIRHVPVVARGRVVGLVSDRDVRSAARGDPERTRVADIMTRDVLTVSPAARVEEAARLMLAHRIGALPVLERGELVGIVTTTDLLRALVDLLERATLDRIAVDYPGAA